jgi:predicted nucleic acid-binding protein
MFTRLCNDNVTVMPVSRAQFRIAARFADQYALGLRAGDALHLAVCAEQDATIYTLDRRLSEAASALGIKTALL